MKNPKHRLDMPSFESAGEKFVVDTTRQYANGALCVQVYCDDGAMWGILSVNLPGYSEMLYPGEFYAKTWSENAGWSADALESGLFVDTGCRVKTGFVEAQLWRVNF